MQLVITRAILNKNSLLILCIILIYRRVANRHLVLRRQAVCVQTKPENSQRVRRWKGRCFSNFIQGSTLKVFLPIFFFFTFSFYRGSLRTCFLWTIYTRSLEIIRPSTTFKSRPALFIYCVTIKNFDKQRMIRSFVYLIHKRNDNCVLWPIFIITFLPSTFFLFFEYNSKSTQIEFFMFH